MSSTTFRDSAMVDRLRAVARQLVVTRRLVRLLPVAVVSAAAVTVAWRVKATGDTAEVLLAASFAIGVAPALSDPAAVTLGSSPTSRLWRAVARLTWVVPVALGCWVVARVVTARALDGSVPLASFASWVPGWAPLIVVATYGVVALAVEVGTGASSDVPGLRATIFVLTGTAMATFLPPPLALLPVESFRCRWLAIFGLAALVLVVALADRGRRRTSIRWLV